MGGQKVLLAYKKVKKKVRLNEQAKMKNAKDIFELLKTLSIGEKISARAGSTSMEPMILKGELVDIEIVTLSSVKKGDILAFWDDEVDNIVVHRFYKQKGEKIFCKGDNNLFPDITEVDEKNFLGRLIN